MQLESEEFENPYEFWNAMKKERQGKHTDRRKEWNKMFDEGALPGWHRFTDAHFRFVLNGKNLDFWPGASKWQYQGRINTGDVLQFIKARQKS